MLVIFIHLEVVCCGSETSSGSNFYILYCSATGLMCEELIIAIHTRHFLVVQQIGMVNGPVCARNCTSPSKSSFICKLKKKLANVLLSYQR